MKHQVSASDYQLCVDDGACRALDRGVVSSADRPAVRVSWHDADTYADWLSRKTGEAYRLPTDEEWAFAAGSKFKDDGTAIDDNDPSKRWIARYEREADRAPSDAATRIFRQLRRQRKRSARCRRQRLGMDSDLLRAQRARRYRSRRFKEPKLRRARRRGHSTAPMSPTSSATPGPAAARRVFLRTTSVSGWS